MTKGAWKEASLVAGAAALLALFAASEGALYRMSVGSPPDWLHHLSHALLDWGVVALAWPLVSRLVRRRPVGSGHGLRVLAYAALAVGLGLAKDALFVAVAAVAGESPGAIAGHLPLAALSFDAFAFAAEIGLAHAVAYARAARERELNALRLEGQLAGASLDALQRELQPHFLFNALHGVSALMHRDVDAADEMLSELSDLLRLSLDRRSVQHLPLSEELVLLERYLALMRRRVGDRLEISLDVDPATRSDEVPTFILQPLVENAIRHGVEARAGAGRIWIEASRAGPELRLCVRDDGAGFGPHARERVGLGNTRARLQQLYGEAARLEIKQAERSTEVMIFLPVRVS